MNPADTDAEFYYYAPKPTFTPEEVADTLEKGAELLEVRGHCKGRFETSDGRLCAMGALRKTCQDKYLLCVVAHALEQYLEAQAQTGTFRNIAVWNDSPGRKDTDVIDTLRSLAKDIRNEC